MRTSIPEHLYAVGETVAVSLLDGQMLAKLNPFIIEARLPPVGTLLQYRIKSVSEDCRRVVAEHQLTVVEAETPASPPLESDTRLVELASVPAPSSSLTAKDDRNGTADAFRAEDGSANNPSDHP